MIYPLCLESGRNPTSTVPLTDVIESVKTAYLQQLSPEVLIPLMLLVYGDQIKA